MALGLSYLSCEQRYISCNGASIQLPNYVLRNFVLVYVVSYYMYTYSMKYYVYCGIRIPGAVDACINTMVIEQNCQYFADFLFIFRRSLLIILQIHN